MYNGTPKRENQDLKETWHNFSAVTECTERASIEIVLVSVDEVNVVIDMLNR